MPNLYLRITLQSQGSGKLTDDQAESLKAALARATGLWVREHMYRDDACNVPPATMYSVKALKHDDAAPSIYNLKGYTDRAHYLRCLAQDYGVPEGEVRSIAKLLGQTEDFDGLVSMVNERSEQLMLEDD